MIKILKGEYILPVLALWAVLIGAATIAYANPFYTGTKAQLAIATTTSVTLNPGTGTSTPVYDSYEQYGTNQTNSGTISIPDNVAVLVDGRASTTAMVMNIACEFSDNYNGLTGAGDWYQNEIMGATTTAPGPQNIGVPNSYTFTYASSTVGGAPLTATTNRFQKLVTCPVPLRFVRAVISASGATTSLWYAIVPKKQR